MRTALAFLAIFQLLASAAWAQSCVATLAAPVVAVSIPVVAAPVPNVTAPLTAAPVVGVGCDIEPSAGPANCPAQNVSWKVLLVTYTAPLAALNHGQTGTATKTVLFVGVCSADFICNNGTVSQTTAGFCL